MSMLPGYRATKAKYGEFPTRDDWVRYLEDYAEHHGLRVLAMRSPLHPADRLFNSRRFPADTEAPAGVRRWRPAWTAMEQGAQSARFVL
jgi:hypothetical protein